MKLALGYTMRDVVTGYSGIATQRLEYQNGNVQFALQGKVKEGENGMPESHYIDQHMLDYVDKGVSARVSVPTDVVVIKLGDRVKDRATNVEGIAVSKATFLNGCVYFHVQPDRISTMFDGVPENFFLEHKRLEVIEKQAMVMPKNPVSATTGLRTGGPSLPVKRMKVATQ